MAYKILVAEDEEITLKHILNTLGKEGYDVTGVTDGTEALRKMESRPFDLLITDIKMPGLSGIDLLEKVKEKHLDTEIMIVTGFGSIDSAVSAMKMGAAEYITKPFSLDEIIRKVGKITEQKAQQRENVPLKTYLGMDIAKSERMRNVLKVMEGMKDSDSNVFITGETGVGKSLLARIIHFTSGRRNVPFLSINCATLTEDLLAGELFGHEKGAFKDAGAAKKGLVEMADAGTLFLEEIAEMSANLQAKLLKVIEKREFYRIGGTGPIKVDVRFIASTSRNVSSAISEGKFREDLYYRLNIAEIPIPPLRERREDMAQLCRFFLGKHLPKSGKKIAGFSRDAMFILMNYSFPGNVRELENIIERAIILERSPLITPASLPQSVGMFQGEAPEPDKFKSMAEVEKEYAEKVLAIFEGNKSKAAEALGISRTSLWRILKEGSY